jgi:hypothetical protein
VTKTEATKLADSIRAYWRRKGAGVDVWVEREGVAEAGRKDEYTVRSNMVAGLPPSPSQHLINLLTPRKLRNQEA